MQIRMRYSSRKARGAYDPIPTPLSASAKLGPLRPQSPEAQQRNRAACGCARAAAMRARETCPCNSDRPARRATRWLQAELGGGEPEHEAGCPGREDDREHCALKRRAGEASEDATAYCMATRDARGGRGNRQGGGCARGRSRNSASAATMPMPRNSALSESRMFVGDRRLGGRAIGRAVAR